MMLPSSCEAIADDAQTTIDEWISELPEDKRDTPIDYNFKDQWYQLLGTVSMPQAGD